MILISHRGNTIGPIEFRENEPSYLDNAIKEGYDIELDVWFKDDILWLGHDEPKYIVDFKWFKDRIMKLWIHCKNTESVIFFKNCGYDFNYFWHETDTITLTSKKYIWAYPGKQPIKDSISVMPEINNDDTTTCFGICSDFVKKYKQ